MFTYDPTTDLGLVRLLIPDRVTPDHLFDDDELQAFIALEGGVKRAAAVALETIASDEVLTQKAIRLLHLQTDGPRSAQALMARAQALRTQAESEESAGAFDWAELAVDDFSARERLLKRGW